MEIVVGVNALTTMCNGVEITAEALSYRQGSTCAAVRGTQSYLYTSCNKTWFILLLVVVA